MIRRIPDTPVAGTAAAVRRLARGVGLDGIDARVSVCRACPRLVRWREDVAVTKRASYAGRAVLGPAHPRLGRSAPRILVVGLAPAANGGNRTGRIFTGDRSGDWLVASLHRVGLATQGTSEHAADGLRADRGPRMVATVRCAPPQNKPTTAERTPAPRGSRRRSDCSPGRSGWPSRSGRSAGTRRCARSASLGWEVPRPKPRFGHGAEAVIGGPERDVLLLGCFHPSQQNTFTGRLTETMLDEVLARAAAAATMAP